MPQVRLWDGHNWQRANSNHVRVWDGHNWSRPHVRLWDGQRWVEGLEERRVTTWEATWTNGYWSGEMHGNIAKTGGGYAWGSNTLAQGSYSPYHDHWDWGNEGGMAGFDDGNMRWELAGARIEKVELYLHSKWWGYGSGGEAVIGTHNARGWQKYFQERDHGVVRQRFYWRGQDMWMQMPNWVGEGLRDNWLAGITTKADNPNLWQYGIFSGTNDGWQKPKIRITYWK